MSLPISAQFQQATSQVIDRCERCIFLKACGGIPAFTQMWNCFDLYQSKQPCDEVCPNNPEFAECLAEVRGLLFDNVGPVRQAKIDLPLYVPHLNHRYSRHFPLAWPIVAITTYELFRVLADDRYQAVASDPQSLRQYFHLAPATRIVLKGTEVDTPLERYWSYRHRDQAAEQIARLGVDLVIGPNFSHFTEVPRTDNLFNRKRQLICLEEMSKAGLNPVPHLSAAVDADWEYWGRYLRDNPSITLVAKELQTGNRLKINGINCVERIDALQQRLGRALHPIMIGGTRLVEAVAPRFNDFTLIDSRPFMESLHRRLFQPIGRRPLWVSEQLLFNIKIDDYLLANFHAYAEWIALRTKMKSGLRHLRHRKTA